MEKDVNKEIGRVAIFKKLTRQEKINFLCEILEHPDLWRGICYLCFELKYSEAFGINSFMQQFKYLHEFANRKRTDDKQIKNRWWFVSHSERVMHIKKQIKILEDGKEK